MWWWKNRREIESLKDRLDALEWGSGPRPADLEDLRKEVALQGEAVRKEQGEQLGGLRTEIKKAAFWGSLVAGLTALLLGWQVWQQRVLIQQQGAQISQQASDTEIVRRTQLLTLIYEPSNCDLEEEAKTVFFERGPQCDPKAPLRLRQEAVLALARIDGKELNLEFANLEFATLIGANLSGADLNGATLTEANLSHANLSGADLNGATLTEANLNHANLSGADLEVANLEDATLIGANLEVANLEVANLEDAHLSGAHLFRANLLRADLSGAHLFYAHLEFATLIGANLEDATLIRANLEDANLYGANLQGANLEFASLHGSNLEDATLTEANLSRANLSGADLSGVDLSRVTLSHANLSGASLEDGKNLTQEQLNITCGDSETQIPERLKRPEHWLDRPAQLDDIRQHKGCL